MSAPTAAAASRSSAGRLLQSSALPPAIFALVTAALLAAHQGGVVRLLFPIGALLIAGRLLATSSAGYVSFVLWLWALAPLVRRIADQQAGWQDASLVLLTPYLASGAGAARAVLACIVDPRRRAQLPAAPITFALPLFGAFCGISLGFAAGTPAAMIETLNWVTPVLFGAYVATCTADVEAIESAVVTTFSKIAVVVGLYGAYQFLQLPPWDSLWMINSDMTSIGRAEALSVRVFSTMHSPGVLGYFILLPIAFWFANPRVRTLLPVCFAAITLLLSQVRSAWAALAVAAILILARMRLATALRVAVLAGIGVMCILPFLQLPDVAERVNARIETFKDMPNFDESASARTEGYLLTLDYMTTHPFGAGVGANPPELDVVGVRDSTIISGFVQFGVVGMLIYTAGIVLMVTRIAAYYLQAPNPNALGIAAAGLGLISIFMLGIPTAAQPGILTWMAAGLATARMGRQPVTLDAAVAAEPPAAFELATARGLSTGVS